ncbi:MAG TPA: nuclear transport factor 2 family protein [Acidimicrobiales bacterium]
MEPVLALAAVLDRFLGAFEQGDLAAVRDVLDDDFVGRVTSADGGTKELTAEQYVASIAAMDVPTAELTLSVPDLTAIADDTMLVMIEVRAARNGRTLHNFSGQLARIRDGRILELSMVDALPSESDEFWSA